MFDLKFESLSTEANKKEILLPMLLEAPLIDVNVQINARQLSS